MVAVIRDMGLLNPTTFPDETRSIHIKSRLFAQWSPMRIEQFPFLVRKVGPLNVKHPLLLFGNFQRVARWLQMVVVVGGSGAMSNLHPWPRTDVIEEVGK